MMAKKGLFSLNPIESFGALGKGIGVIPKKPNLVPPPARDNPTVLAARELQRQADKRRKGRAASILTDPEDQLGAAPVARPTALGG